ncbi:hypothetical protein [Brachyspira innocens]|uniref:hypothetical protein n=1 Tax=Brachyspira innocens TaxID=13264 RepID=UPI000365C2B0|nr:hypothetical protein [Brachyspira innocens]
MNKKILSIIFTLFLAGLLSISCSNKDKTGPGDNGGGSTTIPENGTGINNSYGDRKFPAQSGNKVTVVGENINEEISDYNNFILNTLKSDKSILVKMPLLKNIGFTADVIKIPAKNIVEGDNNNYTIKTRYTLEETADKTVTVDLEAESFNISGAWLKMKVNLTKTTTVKDAEPVTEIYTIETVTEDGIKHASSGRPAINGTGAIEPKY